MTIIVWDGTSLAADRQSSVGDMTTTCEKIRKLDDGRLFAYSGSEGLVLAMAEHLLTGSPWPTVVGDEGATLVVVNTNGEVVYYTSNRPTAVKVHQSWFTWGSGREFAAGALAMGADARRAAEVACQLCHYCGCGIDVMRPGIEPVPEAPVYDLDDSGTLAYVRGSRLPDYLSPPEA